MAQLTTNAGAFVITNTKKRIKIVAPDPTLFEEGFMSFTLGVSNDINDVSSDSGKIYFSGTSGYFVSYEIGESSSRPTFPISASLLKTVADSSGNLYVIASGTGVYKSIDSGENWALSLSDANINHIAANGSTIVVCDSASTSGQVSTDNGDNWSSSSQNSAALNLSKRQILKYVTDVGFVKLCQNGLINVSTDGSTWTEYDYSSLGLGDWSACDFYKSFLYVSTEDGEMVKITSDFGTATDITEATIFNKNLSTGYAGQCMRVFNDKLYSAHTGNNIQILDTDVWRAASVGVSSASGEIMKNIVEFNNELWIADDANVFRSLG